MADSENTPLVGERKMSPTHFILFRLMNVTGVMLSVYQLVITFIYGNKFEYVASLAIVQAALVALLCILNDSHYHFSVVDKNSRAAKITLGAQVNVILAVIGFTAVVVTKIFQNYEPKYFLISTFVYSIIVHLPLVLDLIMFNVSWIKLC
jgi:hypothetical protein